MTDLERIKQLSGMHPQRALLEELKADRSATLAAYDQLIRDVEQGHQLDEGLFTNLKATLASVGQLGAIGAKRISDAARKVASDVKEVYLDQKAKIELENLTKKLKSTLSDFETMEKDASTIIKRDPEVRQEMVLFKKVFEKLLETLGTRTMLAKQGGKRVEPTA